MEMDNRTTQLLTRYQSTRKMSRDIAEPLQPEDQMIQSMPDASPTKWHLAHTSWFFETFVLNRYLPGYQPYAPEFAYLFNSYYNQVGPQYRRPQRGLISRPTVAEVHAYRQYVDDHLQALLRTGWADPAGLQLIELGVQHEQQHQELMLTDIKHGFSFNPLYPALVTREPERGSASTQHWLTYTGGQYNLGYDCWRQAQPSDSHNKGLW